MKKIDLSSPVEILACELPKNGYAACDLTLFNLSGDQVTSVEATLTLLDESGEEIARVIHRARSLNGAPRKTFVMAVPAEDMTRARDWEATVDKVWFDNSSIWRRSKTGMVEYEPNRLEPSNALNDLRAVAGEDAVGYPSDQGAVWLCVCGRPNDSGARACVRCQRKKAEIFAHCSREAVAQVVAEQESRLSEQARQTVAGSSEKQLQREKEYEKSRKKRRMIIAAVVAVVVLLGGAYVGVTRLGPQLKYQKAIEAFNSGDYAQAEESFLALEGFGESEDYVLRCRYEAAKAQLNEGTAEQIASARAAFEALGDYQDAAAQVTECDYQRALLLLEDGDREGAAAILTELGDYQDSVEQLRHISYLDAADAMESGDFERARAMFEALGDYQDAAGQAQDSWYREAESALDNGDADAALALLEKIPGHAGAAELSKRAHYARATALREAGEIDQAAQEFAQAEDYEDAAQQASECFYAPAAAAFEAGQYDRAAELFSHTRGYKDSDDKWTTATYEAAKKALKDLEYTRASTLLASLPEDYEDVAELRKECVYRPALAACDRGEYETALTMFSEIGDYADTQEQIKRSRYGMASEMLSQGDAAGAIEQFTILGDYSDSAKQLQAAQAVQAEGYLALGTAEGYQQAIDAYTALGDYGDSADKLKAARYGQAELLLADGDYVQARPIFEELGAYGESADRVKACIYAEAKELNEQELLPDAAELFLSIAGYEDARTQALAIWYTLGAQAAEAGDHLTAAQYYQQAEDYEDAKAQSALHYDEYYGGPASQAQIAYNGGDYIQCAAILHSVELEDLPEKFSTLPALYQAACYEAGNQLYDAGQPYAALAYYREIPGYRNVDTRLQHACYLILGTWTDLDGVTYTFKDDGTLTIGDEKLYFLVDGTTLRTGASPETLSDTHRLTGVTRRNAWLFDRRGDKEITIYLTKDETAAAFQQKTTSTEDETPETLTQIPLPVAEE